MVFHKYNTYRDHHKQDTDAVRKLECIPHRYETAPHKVFHPIFRVPGKQRSTACMSSNPTVFKSSGVHRLDFGSETGSLEAAGAHPCSREGGSASSIRNNSSNLEADKEPRARLTWLERHQREQKELSTGLAWPMMMPQIPADNVGYGLLRKAGWSEGMGLGSNEQV